MSEPTDYTIAFTPEQHEERNRNEKRLEAMGIYSELKLNYEYLISPIRSNRSIDIAQNNLRRVLDSLNTSPDVLTALQSYLKEINETRFKVVEKDGQLDLLYKPPEEQHRT